MTPYDPRATAGGDSATPLRAALPHVDLAGVAADAAGIRALEDRDWSVARLAERSRGSVLDYRLGNRVRVIAKTYGRVGDAAVAYDILRRLTDRGFAPPSRDRVPQPLACAAEAGVVLMTPAAGDRLAALAGDGTRWDAGLRSAGTWLATLHSLSAHGEARCDAAHEALRLARRSAKACAAAPEAVSIIVPMLAELAARRPFQAGATATTLSHGRYHPGHVFLADDSVTVVDLDRLALGDPAADLGEFLYRLDLLTRRRRLDEASRDLAVRLFVQGYAAGGRSLPATLTYHWSFSVISMLLHTIEVGHPRLPKRIQTSVADFADVPRRATLALGAKGDAT